MKKFEPTPTANPTDRKSLPTTIDLLELIWRRKFVICLGILVGIAAGLLYYVRVLPVYESKAEVLVVQKRPEAVTGEHRYESHFDDYVATHRTVIVSRLIIERAIEAFQLRSLNTYADLDEDDSLADAIIDQLEVGRGSRDLGENANSIMTLTMRGSDPEECPIVVEAVLDSYKAFLDETYRGMSDDTVGLISQARDLLKNDLQEQEEAYGQFRQQSPLVTRGSEEINPLQDRLTAIETERSALLLRRTEIESQLMAIRKARKDKYDPQEMLAMVTELARRPTTDGPLRSASATLETQLFALVDEERKLLEHYGPNHPHVVTIRQRIAAARQFLALPVTAHMQQPESALDTDDGTAEMDPVELYTRQIERELEGLRISEELLTGIYERAHENAKELTSYQLKDEQFQRNIDRTQQLYDGVITQLQDASLIKDYGGFEARVIAGPQAGKKVWPSGRIILPVSLFLGSLFGFFLGIVAELSDKRFHSREQIQAEFDLAVVGQIPRFSAAADSERRAIAGGTALDPMLCACLQPRSPHAEAYRAVRNKLCVGHGSASRRVIQITSLNPGDGKSLLAANLAITLAQAGKRVLLMDAHVHRPRQHELFGISSETGLVSVVAVDSELNDAICRTAVDGLWILPTGEVSPNQPDILTSARFSELVGVVREQFDCVLVDTGPLLAASDPWVVAAQMDGVLVTLRLTKNSRRDAQQAKEILDTLDSKLLGVVVNGIGGPGSRGYRYELYSHYNGYHEYGNGKSSSLDAAKTVMQE